MGAFANGMVAEPRCIDSLSFAYCKVENHMNLGMDGYKDAPLFIYLFIFFNFRGKGKISIKYFIYCYYSSSFSLFSSVFSCKKKGLRTLFISFQGCYFIRDRTFII